jgi:protein-S-isoprenylcysteine O-methyltransferase Ste14
VVSPQGRSAREVAARVLYGALFTVVVPAALVAWARALAPHVSLPPVHSGWAGMVLFAAGVLLLAAGARELRVRGDGLPMNAFPPQRLVRTGVYRWLANPMYLGFGLACAGVAIATGSAAGLWLVTPTAWLAAAALVVGFERHDLARRFGPAALQPPLLSLPRGDGERPTALERAAVFAWLFIPWLAAYFAVQALGRRGDAFGTALAFERDWPVLQWTVLLYASAYVFIPATVLVLRTRRDLRRFALQGAVATIVVAICWLTIPVVAENRRFEPAGWPGRLLAFEQAHSNGVAAFPALHVLWSLLSADAWASNSAAGGPWWRWGGWSLGALISASCLTTGMHSVADVAAAVVLFPPLRRVADVWATVRARTEWLANAWAEWRVGPIRIINHVIFAFAAAGAGLLVAGSAASGEHRRAVLWTGACVLVGAGFWAQAFEGSSKLLRPFGWYGGVLGAAIGALAAGLTGHPVLPLLAAFAVAAPWVQLIGRLRCLVQGCCHGGPAGVAVGIRYRHPRSRVTQLAGLADVPIHATPLYSIAGNFVIGVALLRLRFVGAPDALLVGLYLILSGIARFVEESYRAEPQTPIVAGLHSYQWIAAASVVIGIVATTIPSASAARPFAPLDGPFLLGALALALATGFAMGVDFPRSNRRFSRLAAAD